MQEKKKCTILIHVKSFLIVCDLFCNKKSSIYKKVNRNWFRNWELFTKFHWINSASSQIPLNKREHKIPFPFTKFQCIKTNLSSIIFIFFRTWNVLFETKQHHQKRKSPAGRLIHFLSTRDGSGGNCFFNHFNHTIWQKLLQWI